MKRLVVLLLLIPLAATLPAFDFGGYLDNTTGYATPPPGAGAGEWLIQETTVALWLTQSFGSWELDAQGSYTFTPSVPLLFDVDRLTMSTAIDATGAGATTLEFTAGRTRFRDTTGYVLNHTLDGLKVEVAGDRSSFRVGVGTTALLQKPTNQIVLGTLDILDLSDPAVVLAPRRLVTEVEYRLIEAVGSQSIALGATVQEDLRPQAELTLEGQTAFDPAAGGRVETQYVTLKLSGALAPTLFQTTYYTLNSGRRLEYVEDAGSGTGFSYQYQTLLAHMAGLELTLFLPETLNSRARFFGQFTTGETDWSSAFVPISPSSYSDVFSLQPGNSAHVGVSYSLRPLATTGADVLQTELATVAYFETSGVGYVGTDINLGIIAVPLSDVRLVLKNGFFVPNAAVASPGNENVKYQVTLQGVIRF